MVRLEHRSQYHELIDNPHTGFRRQTYHQIQSINTYTLGYWPTINAVKYFLNRVYSHQRVKILDIGCGNGDLLSAIADYGQKKGIQLKLTGIDLNSEAIAIAKARKF